MVLTRVEFRKQQNSDFIWSMTVNRVTVKGSKLYNKTQQK